MPIDHSAYECSLCAVSSPFRAGLADRLNTRKFAVAGQRPFNWQGTRRFIMTRLIIGVVFVGLLALLCGCETKSSEAEPDDVRTSQPVVVDFWSGKRSEARQVYERQVLEPALVAARAEYGPWQISETMDE